MTEHYGNDPAPTSMLDSIQAGSAALYGEDAQFAYQLPDGQYAILSLSEVILICGDHIRAEKNIEILRYMLSEFYDNAQKILNSQNEALIRSSHQLGQLALKERATG